MPKMSIEVRHCLGLELAKERVEPALTGTPGLTVTKQEWVGNNLFFSAEIKNVSVDGCITVDVTNLVCDVTYPWYASPMAGKAKQELEKKLQELLS